MGIIQLGLRLIERFCLMFLVGEKFGDIKSMCFVHLGNYFHDKRKFEKAIAFYNKALIVSPFNYYANAGLGIALVEKKKFREALSSLKNAISIKKPDVLVSINLYVSYEVLGEVKSREDCLKEILLFYNNNEAAAYDAISYTYYKLNMYKEAEHYIRKALNIRPNESGIHYNLAKIHLAQGNLKMARDEFQKVLELTSNKDKRRFEKYAVYHLRDIEEKLRKR